MQFGLARRSLFGNSSCGDDAFTFANDERAVMAVIDGLGHGERAAIAAQVGIRQLRATPLLPLSDMMQALHQAMKNTVGGAATIAVLHKSTRQLEVCGIGNVQFQLATASKLHRDDGTPGIVGVYDHHCQLHTYQYHPGNFIVLYTDGIKSSFSAHELIHIMHPDPQRIALQILRQHQRGTDDALVLVGWEPPTPD